MAFAVWQVVTQLDVLPALQPTLLHGSHSFTDKKIHDFSRTFQDPMKNFPGPFRSPQMFKYKEKTAFIYNIQSVVHCRKFPFEPLEKCMTFKDIFPGLSRTLSFNFQDFPGPKWFSRTLQVLEFWRKKIQDFPGGVETLQRSVKANLWDCWRTMPFLSHKHSVRALKVWNISNYKQNKFLTKPKRREVSERPVHDFRSSCRRRFHTWLGSDGQRPTQTSVHCSRPEHWTEAHQRARQHAHWIPYQHWTTHSKHTRLMGFNSYSAHSITANISVVSK